MPSSENFRKARELKLEGSLKTLKSLTEKDFRKMDMPDAIEHAKALEEAMKTAKNALMTFARTVNKDDKAGKAKLEKMLQDFSKIRKEYDKILPKTLSEAEVKQLEDLKPTSKEKLIAQIEIMKKTGSLSLLQKSIEKIGKLVISARAEPSAQRRSSLPSWTATQPKAEAKAKQAPAAQEYKYNPHW